MTTKKKKKKIDTIHPEIKEKNSIYNDKTQQDRS